jgi:hypothetical protein
VQVAALVVLLLGDQELAELQVLAVQVVREAQRMLADLLHRQRILQVITYKSQQIILHVQ